jgi:hypothetical protein
LSLPHWSKAMPGILGPLRSPILAQVSGARTLIRRRGRPTKRRADHRCDIV